jgi:nitrite reductase (NO-forming)
VPGNYVLVDHSIFRAFNKGALAILEVTGEPTLDIYSGKQLDEMYIGDKVASLAPVAEAAPAQRAIKRMARDWQTCFRRSPNRTIC